MTLAQRCILAHPNWCDADPAFAPVSMIDTIGTYEETLPRSNLLKPNLHQPARTIDCAHLTSRFMIDLGTPRGVMVFVLPKHNISRIGQIRISGYTTETIADPVYDSGFIDVWDVVYPFGYLPWGDPSAFDGKLSEEEASTYNVGFTHVAPGTVPIARYWLWEIHDQTNDDRQIDFYRPFMAPGWQASINMSVGASIGFDSATSISYSDGGVVFADRRPIRRTMRFTIDYLSQDEAFSRPFEMARQAGIDRQVYVIHDPTDTIRKPKRSFLARFKSYPRLTYSTSSALMTPEFDLEEVL